MCLLDIHALAHRWATLSSLVQWVSVASRTRRGRGWSYGYQKAGFQSLFLLVYTLCYVKIFTIEKSLVAPLTTDIITSASVCLCVLERTSSVVCILKKKKKHGKLEGLVLYAPVFSFAFVFALSKILWVAFQLYERASWARFHWLIDCVTQSLPSCKLDGKKSKTPFKIKKFTLNSTLSLLHILFKFEYIGFQN